MRELRKEQFNSGDDLVDNFFRISDTLSTQKYELLCLKCSEG